MVEVIGNIDNLQSSIDFYLNITSKEEVLESRFMRDRFFEIFDRENSYKKENFLVYQDLVSDDYMIDSSVEPELVGSECIFDSGFSYFNNDVKDDLINDGFEYENSGYGNEESEDGWKSLPVEENHYEDADESEDGYSNWGSSLEDEEDLEDDDSDDFVVQDYVEVPEKSNFEGNSLEPENKEVFDEKQEIPKSEVDINTEDLLFTDDFEDLDFFSGSFDYEDDTIKEVKNVVIDKKLSKDENVVDVPKDLRDFVKMYPNCELSFVYKYFSKKEVDKQLRLGRVFKRKNRLLI